MMKYLIFFLFVIPVISLADSTRVKPEFNQCSPLMNTKKYLSTDFENYPRKVVFECTYECNDNGSISEVVGTSSVYITSINEDALMTACQGVMIKKVPWGYDFDKIIPFYASETGLIEIKRWAFTHVNFDPLVNSKERQNLLELKQKLQQIIQSYKMAGNTGVAGSVNFLEAGICLEKIAEALPMDTRLLDQVIEQIVVNKGVVGASGTTEFLIQSIIASTANWRIPTYLYEKH